MLRQPAAAAGRDDVTSSPVAVVVKFNVDVVLRIINILPNTRQLCQCAINHHEVAFQEVLDF